MPGTFTGLEVARRAMQANQIALDLTGRNVANANTRGYSRQALAFTTTPPYNVPLGMGSGQIGTGVTHFEVIRFREEFLDRQYRQKAADFGAAEAWVKILDQMEQIWGEPESNGLQTYINNFWSALQALANRPAAPDARGQVIETAKALVRYVQDMYQQLRDLQDNLDTTLAVKAEEINGIAAEIAKLNQQIMVADVSRQFPNDLRDKRDLLLDNLARLAGATWVHQPDGQTNVYINGQPLVTGTSFKKIIVDKSGSQATLRWDVTNMPVTFRSGELSALMTARDQTIPEYISYLEVLMGRLTYEFNVQHRQGSPGAGVPPLPPTGPGGEFFTVTYLDPPANTRADLTTLAVNVTVADIRAHEFATGGSLDGGNAKKLADLFQTRLVTHALTGAAPVTFLDFHRAVLGQLGVVSQAQRTAENTLDLQVKQAENMRQSVGGVSLDEEMTKMIEFQHAYQAAARMATANDEILDTIVSRLGIVGR